MPGLSHQAPAEGADATRDAPTGRAASPSSLRAGLAGDGDLRWVAADVTQVTEEARRRLDLSPISAAALGRALAGAAILQRLSRERPDRLSLELAGDGPLGSLAAEADAAGNLRGRVANRRVDLPPTTEGKLPVGAAVGRGVLRVVRETAAGSHRSQVALVSGEIGEDLAHFLAQGEQARSAVLVGVLARPAGVAAAGGVVVEALPGASEDTLRRLEGNLAAVRGVSRLIEEGGLDGMLEALLDGLGASRSEELPLRYHCGCSRDRLRRHLVALVSRQPDDILSPSGRVEVECAFCGAGYTFDNADLRR